MLDKLLSASSVEIFPVQLPTKETSFQTCPSCILKNSKRVGESSCNLETSSFFTGDKLPCGQRVHSLGLCAFKSSSCAIFKYFIYSNKHCNIYWLLAVGLLHCCTLRHCYTAWSLTFLFARYLDDKGVAKNLEA